jgi:spore maturation protein CgeB
MDEPRLEISNRLRRILDYPKFIGPTRMLVLETDYYFDKSWARAAEQLGWETAAVSSAMVGGITKKQIRDLLRTIGQFKPDFILTSNYAGMDALGLFARFFEDVKIPYVSWFTDTPRMILYERAVHPSPYAVAATWERGYTPHFEALGFEHIHYMPLATDPDLFNGAPSSVYKRPVAFLGCAMIDHAAEAWEMVEELPEAAKALHAAFDAGAVTRTAFSRGVETIIAPEILEQCDARTRRHVELCLVYEATKRMRIDLVRAAEPFGVEAHGDVSWLQVTAKADGDVAYFDSTPGFYRETADKPQFDEFADGVGR